MVISGLRQTLRASGIKDENMHFDDASDGSIIPRLVFQSHEVVTVEPLDLTASILHAEKCDPSDNLDNRG